MESTDRSPKGSPARKQRCSFLWDEGFGLKSLERWSCTMPQRAPPVLRPPSEAAPPGGRMRRPLVSRLPLLATIAIFMVVALMPISGVSAMSPSTDPTFNKESGVCASMDLRNTLDKMNKLKGCRVIEGFLQILLIENYNETSFQELSFPELTEITGYLLLYRVNGIKSLSKLFPNLAVIRGQKLFNNYALVIYEMFSMEEIGLHSLTDIERGSVRIEKNTNLCYVNTIDWNQIAIESKGGNYIAENQNENECPLCPKAIEDQSHSGSMTHMCPEDPKIKEEHKRKRYLCWNNRHCQKICPTGCRTCNENKVCCDDSCLGGCVGNPNNCSVCRNYSIGDYGDRQCVKECPLNLFKYYERRCITQNECRELNAPKELSLEKDAKIKHFKPINGVCTMDCPVNFFESIKGKYTHCVPCEGPCKRECHGEKIDSIQAAQKLRGCTHISGVLEISVRGGGNIVKELEEGLGLIVDISGSLKIARSYPLVSLNFLKSLKKIRGLDLLGNKIQDNVFTVTDNQNLQELWDWDQHGDIEIPYGKLFFHFNPKLCFDKIEPLRRMAKESEFNELEVATTSNGDKIACNVFRLNVTVAEVRSRHILINWSLYNYDDPRSLLGYVVYFIEAPIKNVTLYEGRDACGGDGWHVDDVTVMVTHNNSMGSHILSRLEPFTQYAVYIKTYTIATEKTGAQSDIIYVRTLPGEPSKPRIIDLTSPDPESIFISWLPSEKPSGILRKYRVYVYWEPENEETLMQRNYCNSPLVPPSDTSDQVSKPLVDEKKSEPAETKDKCSCEAKTFPKDEDVLNKITFEDYLHNSVFQKNYNAPDITRKRRQIGPQNQRQETFPDIKYTYPPEQEFKTETAPQGYYVSYWTIVENQTSLTVGNLRHYSRYTVKVWACREVEEEEFKTGGKIENCSISEYRQVLTRKKAGADDIHNVTVHLVKNNSTSEVTVRWDEPDKPNGYILSYTITYQKVNGAYEKPSVFCLPRKEYLNAKKSHFMNDLNSGNYSITIYATSLAGNGNVSNAKYVLIENPDSTSSIVWGAIAIVLLIIGAVLAVIFWNRCRTPLNMPKTLIADVNPEYISNIYVPDEWEVCRSNIELIKELGQGSFGMVYEGKAKNLPKISMSEVRCAVKTINEHATERERMDFLKEASVMKGFDTQHVVHLLGVVSTGQPTLVIMELMEFGDLKSYLRSHREQQKPSLARITHMALEIADGMAYLSAKKFVHRDLAARNCMVSGDLTVKVGDFGMTRDIYETDYYRKGSKGLLPVRWMSPESLKDGVFTSSSDAWSYGVVLWEMATLASQPYQGLSNDQVVRYVIDGGVMERPENCPDNLYQLMQMTWQHRARYRPTFLELVAYLANDATPEFRQNSFFFSTEGQELYQQHLPQHPVVMENSNGHSVNSAQLIPAWEPSPRSQECDSPIVTPHAPISPISSYRERIRLVPFSDKSRGEPHELEALVTTYSHSAPPPPCTVKTSVSSTMSICPNGYLIHPSNNGNPMSLGSSRC